MNRIPRIPFYVLVLLVVWLATGRHGCIDWCPPPEQRPFWFQFAVHHGWPWCCE